MKKIYSLVLLTTTLLFSTNVMAVDVNDYTNLKSQIEGAVADATLDVTITGDFTFGGTITIQNGQTINLDLKGHNLSFGDATAFLVYNGHLNISNSEKLTQWGKIFSTSTAKSSTSYKENGVTHSYYVPNKGIAIQLGGTEDPTSNNYSTLTVGDSVEISGHSRGIYVEYKGTTANMAGGANSTILDALNSKNVYKGCSFGVRVDVYGAKVSGEKYGMQLSGNINWSPAEGVDIATTNVPLFYVHSGAEITSLPDSISSIGIYCAGFGRTIIEGTVHAATGVYAKSGDITVNNANIYSDAGRYTEAKGKSSGVASTGTAILMDSNKSYAGEMNITITGDSKIEGKGGYAIESSVTTAVTNEVKGVTIEGGEFISGDKGCMDMTPVIDALVNGEDVKIKIDNTTFDNKTESGGVIDLLTAAAGDDYYVAQTTKRGETVYVITERPEEAVVVPQNTSIDQTDGLKWITWTDHTGAVSIDEAKVAFLSLEGSSHLTIPSGKILHVGSVVVTTYSDITVEPGGQLIIDSVGGFVANQTTNLILQSNASGSAVFVLHPNVVANTHPSATVQMYAKAHKTGNVWHSQHVAIPTIAAPTITFPAGGNTYAAIWKNGTWVDVQSISEFDTPFRGYAFDFSGSNPAGIYTYKGNIVGSGNGTLNFTETEWNVMGNSYNAPIDAKQMLDDLNAELGADVEGTMWIYLSAEDRHESATALLIEEHDADFETIAPMQGFIMRRNAADAVVGSVNYERSVWSNPNKTNIAILAPARRAANKASKATVVITTAKSHDKVVLRESSAYSDAFDNGADASKFMDERVFNFYGSNAETTLSQIASDNLDGKKLSLQATDETVYTMSFANVNNFDYVLRDNANGTIIPVEEGQTYTFNVAAGTTAADRFELVDVRKMPTALDNVKAAAKAKGIYTVLGQYLGETDQLNKLPKGIYLVDGNKIIK